MKQFAIDLAQFLKELQSIDTSNAPIAGKHNFYRGGSLSIYDEETRTVIKNIKNKFDSKIITNIWDKALKSKWSQSPVWIHGDIAPGNLLINSKCKLCGVIDFGIMGVGDPACDLAIAWTFFNDESRQAFKTSMSLNKETWERAMGWELWKSLITYNAFYDNNPTVSFEMEKIINVIIEDFQ